MSFSRCKQCGQSHLPDQPHYDYTRKNWFMDDWMQTNKKDARDTIASPDRIVIPGPPPGQYWLIDRIAVACDDTANGVATLYVNDESPVNIVRSYCAQLNELAIPLDFNPTHELGPGENLLLVTSALGVALSYNMWYRVRTILQSPMPLTGVLVTQPQAPAGVGKTAPNTDGAENIQAPATRTNTTEPKQLAPEGDGESPRADPTYDKPRLS
jgi:hypothetical protein